MRTPWCLRSEVPPRKAVELNPEDAKSIVGAEDLFREVPALHFAILCPSRFCMFGRSGCLGLAGTPHPEGHKQRWSPRVATGFGR